MFVIAFLLMMAPHVSSQTYNPPCYYKSPDGEFTLDFSTLRGKRFVSHGKDPLGKEYSYYFTPCNTIGDGEIECVMDPEGVLTGMAIQREGDDCFVLGQFDSSITPKNWGIFSRTPKASNKVQHCLPLMALHRVATATCHVIWK